MAVSKSFNLGLILGQDNKISTEVLSADVPLGTEDYSTANDLPATGNQVGDQAFVQATNRLYIWTGAGWYNIALINQTPTWDANGLPEAAYELDSIGGESTTIQLAATDPEDLPIQWTYSVTDSGNDLATITNESNGTFTITAKSLADIIATGYDSSGGIFDVTFKVSDGVNLATAISEFTISFLSGGFQGSNYGYTSGGYNTTTNRIDKFPFASDTNATNVGNLVQSKYGSAGQSSSDYGYASGGRYGSTTTDYIDRFPFVTDTNATDVGDITVFRYRAAGQSSSEYGYTSGGSMPPGYYGIVGTIDKFSFSAETNAAGVGSLYEDVENTAGQSSSEYGYTSGGNGDNSKQMRIQKFSFASNGNARNVGNIAFSVEGPAGQSSSDYGYTSGGQTGYTSSSLINHIDKFPFASDTSATDVGDLTRSVEEAAGQSSTDYGYTSGGAPWSNRIDKFPFASDTNATDVGDLTLSRSSSSGQQY